VASLLAGAGFDVYLPIYSVQDLPAQAAKIAGPPSMCWAAVSRTGLGLPGDAGDVGVEPLDLVEVAGLVEEHVDHHVAVVDQHPLLLAGAFDP